MLAVDRLTSFAQLDKIKDRWIELYHHDERAHFFTSWEWLQACLKTETNPWMVLAVRDGNGPYIGFLWLGDGRFPTFGPPLNRELYLGGIPRADFTGILIADGAESSVIPELARYIHALPWDNFTLNDWPDDRIAALIAEFPEISYRAKTADPSPCPLIALPATWDEYLKSRGRHMRQNLKAKMRKVESVEGFRFEVTRKRDAEAAVSKLLDLNASRWNKSRRKRERTFGDLFRMCYANGTFLIGSIKFGDELVATQGSFIDRKTMTSLGYMMAYDAKYTSLSAGSVLVACSIRHAIEHGFKFYDLSRGDEYYKKQFSTSIRNSNHVTLTRRTMRVAAVNAGRSGYFKAKSIARNILRPSA